ncbi:hypothetical protein [Actinomadura livida]|uniref:JAB domain-containing protein n=1 Tax=Actinomadura livida TaxID=79909 RepID=A0A7W7MVI9_9ACTN|nr:MULTISPECIES: hypothetical protein [Actinomadura]MBB4771844.1 hypothetical protein [Actinomadura catellatispora]GGU02818.1 hypothetical protein GCM10010208_28680 [Actinomadura livida]
MRCVLRLPSRVWGPAAEHLLASASVRMAYLLARASSWTDPWGGRTTDPLVRQALLVPDAALHVQSPVRVEVDPEFTRQVLRACYETGMSLVDVHTHPFGDGPVWFSGHDEHNMRVTHTEFADTMPDDPPAIAASLVLGPGGLAGAWSPHPRRLAPLDACILLDHPLSEVPLCTP